MVRERFEDEEYARFSARRVENTAGTVHRAGALPRGCRQRDAGAPLALAGSASTAMTPLQILAWPEPARVPETVDAFLRTLAGPTLIQLPGRDRARCRAVVTLLHGNEPSGLRAVHRWLRGGRTPATDALVLIAAVDAALEPPGFAHRALPAARDLNRCFRPPWTGAGGALARSVLAKLDRARPEALVDLHNNTGHNPPYGVAPRIAAPELRLTSFFGERMVHSELELGAIVEATSARSPSVTIECGRAGDPDADAVAYRGLERFLLAPDLELDAPAPPVEILVDPIRVCLRDGLRVAFGDRPVEGADLTVLPDVDRHNFQRLPAGEPIAWLRDDLAWPVEAWDARGRERSHELLAATDGVLAARRDFIPIMMTLDPAAAVGDCLFYAVRPGPGNSACSPEEPASR